MESEILALSSSGPLPIPIGGDGRNRDDENGVAGYSPRLLGASPTREPIAPYQALPVTAQLITEHITPALPVIDHSKLTEGVRHFYICICDIPAARSHWVR